jgi:hypothetical protein
MRVELPAAVSTVHPLAISVSIADTGKILNRSRASVYVMLGDGKLTAVKDGSRTMVLIDSIKAYQASLPVASFTPTKPRSENPAKLPRRRRRKSKAVPE